MPKTTSRILLFIPCYRVEKQIPRVIKSLTSNVLNRFSEVLIVDNRSEDSTLEIIKKSLIDIKSECTWTVIQNDQNYGFGGSVKVAFNYAKENGFQYLALLHGDDQGDISDLISLIDEKIHEKYDCLLGSRFLDRSLLKGYSLFRTYGNMFFSLLFAIATLRKITDLGSGLDLYRVDAFNMSDVKKFPNDLTFPYLFLMFCITKKLKCYSFAIHWSEDDQVSNVKLFKQSFGLIRFFIAFVIFRQYCLNYIMSKTQILAYNSKIVLSIKPAVVN
jgi:glycosyltransferase involved in cell wall biosynthesis